MLEKDQLEKINKEILKKFPYLGEKLPRQKDMPGNITQLSYSGVAKTANGMQLPITIKVKVSSDGNIINISTSK